MDGLCLAIQNPAARNQIFNMTYGQARSIRDLLTIIQHHFPGVRFEYVPRDTLRPFRGTLSIDKAARLLGYAPKHPIEMGFAKYIEWYRMLSDASFVATRT